MIKVGTICYIVPDHLAAGKFCTVISPLGPVNCLVADKGLIELIVYVIELCDRTPPSNYGGNAWCARPHHLVPINDPDQAVDETTFQPAPPATVPA